MSKQEKNNKYNLPVNYNELTQLQRREVREQYIKEQKGICRFCSEPLNGEPSKKTTSYPIKWELFPRGKSFLDYPIHLHHDHDTGTTIGAMHAYCNAVSWQYFRK